MLIPASWTIEMSERTKQHIESAISLVIDDFAAFCKSNLTLYDNPGTETGSHDYYRNT
jgi:hypothetical protein